MSDYMTTNCIRLKTEFQNIKELLSIMNKDLLNVHMEDGKDLYEINKILEKDNIRIIDYNDELYVDIIICNDWSDGNDPEFYMSLADIKKIINQYKNKLNFKPTDIYILAHQWYNGCDEPYTC